MRLFASMSLAAQTKLQFRLRTSPVRIGNLVPGLNGYVAAKQLRPHSAFGFFRRAPSEGDPLNFEDKAFNRGTLNEINDITMKLALLNREVWALIERLQSELGVQRVKLPQWPGADQRHQIVHPPIETDEEPPEPPEASEG